MDFLQTLGHPTHYCLSSKAGIFSGWQKTCTYLYWTLKKGTLLKDGQYILLSSPCGRFFLSLYTAIRPHGHSRQVGAASVSTRQ